jgi:hypothetical protein
MTRSVVLMSNATNDLVVVPVGRMGIFASLDITLRMTERRP